MGFKDLSEKRFGRLVAKKIEPSPKRGTYWRCICDCGEETVVYGPSLTRGSTKSCGCFRKEMRSKQPNGLRHGLRYTRIYRTWDGIIQRCYNKSCFAYKDYGERGIVICGEWRHDIKAFYAWAINNGYKETLTIERIDNDGNYCPDNCKWIPQSEQPKNQRKSVRLTCAGQTRTAAEWSRELDMPSSTICTRKRKGWSDEQALSKFIGKDKTLGI